MQLPWGQAKDDVMRLDRSTPSPPTGTVSSRAHEPATSDRTIVGTSDVLKYVMYRVEQVASTNASVLLLGETGTGKELVARAIHHQSRRAHRKFMVVNCSALPPTLIESELFGRDRGAFTGAHTSQPGRFELADGGTIFLDEIGELPLELQPKLLRVLQEGQFERLGSTRTVDVDVRIVAATNRNLVEDVNTGKFRQDLFYRLNVFPITLAGLAGAARRSACASSSLLRSRRAADGPDHQPRYPRHAGSAPAI